MDQMPAQPAIPQAPLPKNKLIILGILISLAMTLFSLNYFKIINFKTSPTPTPAPVSQTPPERTIKESQSPVAFSILQNPIVNQWRGSVEGIVTKKTATSITLSDGKGHEITMEVDINPKTKTPFFTKKDNKFVEVSFNDVSIGNKLRGDFFVAVEDKNKLLSSSFFVE